MILMNKKLFLIAFCLFLCLKSIQAQETLINLQKDGRIIFGSRKDFLLTSLSLKKLSARLQNKLKSSQIVAIIVPSNKTGNKFIIGILLGRETLPEDFETEQNDFDYLRQYATGKSIATLEKKADEIFQLASTKSPDEMFDAKVKELNTIIGDAGESKEVVELYAGFLLAGLPDTPATAKFNETVNKFRTETERTLAPSISRFINEKGSWASPYKVTETEELFTVNDLNSFSFSIARQASPNAVPYLKIWYKKSLIIIPENPRSAFDPLVYRGGLKEYLVKNNSDFRADMIVPEVKLPK